MYLLLQYRTLVDMINNFSFWKNADTVPGVTYKIFSGTTTSTPEVCANGSPEVIYTYTSVSAGNGEITFTTNPPNAGCPQNITLTITACLPSDAIVVGPPVNAGDPISGKNPRVTPSYTPPGTDCS